MREKAAALFKKVQEQICAGLETLDSAEQFTVDLWTRKEKDGAYGGGGDTRVLKQGGIFEQAGVNFSEVHGSLLPEMTEKLIGRKEAAAFYATGVSLVLHPKSPMIPTTHANFRYLEVGGQSWFGGGMDLTPYYLFEEDAIYFHRTIKRVCDAHDTKFYPEFSAWCDTYFFLPHRQETRGIGGIFFDYLGKDKPNSLEAFYPFMSDISNAFLECYVPIAKKRKDEIWGEHEKSWQLLRRGRYVEFNLLYDRGTIFGLKTGGRIESILMSLPPNVRWEYQPEVTAGSREDLLLQTLKNPRAWI